MDSTRLILQGGMGGLSDKQTGEDVLREEENKTAKLLIRLGTSIGMVFLILCFIWLFIGNSIPIAIMDTLIVTVLLSVSGIFCGLYLMDY